LINIKVISRRIVSLRSIFLSPRRKFAVVFLHNEKRTVIHDFRWLERHRPAFQRGFSEAGRS